MIGNVVTDVEDKNTSLIKLWRQKSYETYYYEYYKGKLSTQPGILMNYEFQLRDAYRKLGNAVSSLDELVNNLDIYLRFIDNDE